MKQYRKHRTEPVVKINQFLCIGSETGSRQMLQGIIDKSGYLHWELWLSTLGALELR
jgi:hypothetical protein